MKINNKYLYTGSLVLVAILFFAMHQWNYITNPWTRDGQVNARVIQISPRVAGPIVSLKVKDNQFVKKGDILFEIDSRTYRASFEQAKAQLDKTGYDVAALENQVEVSKASLSMSRTTIAQAQSSIEEIDSQIKTNLAQYERQKVLLPKGATSQKAVDKARTTYEVSVQKRKAAVASMEQAKASVRQAESTLAESRANLGQIGNENAEVRGAVAALRQAELNLEFTIVRAPVDGYITNLRLQLGSQVNANQSALALVDVNSFYVTGYFKETLMSKIAIGNDAIVTLMGYQNKPIDGVVESIGWGISQQDGSTGFELLPTVSPTFEWIRLAQRIPVQIKLNNVPEEVALRVGTTASVLVKTKTSSSK